MVVIVGAEAVASLRGAEELVCVSEEQVNTPRLFGRQEASLMEDGEGPGDQPVSEYFTAWAKECYLQRIIGVKYFKRHAPVRPCSKAHLSLPDRGEPQGLQGEDKQSARRPPRGALSRSPP